MSVSKWAYTPEVCDGGGCPGDCDLCDKPKNMEDEDDTIDYINDAKKRADDSGYFVTDYIKREDAIRAMAQYMMDTALIDNPEASDRIEEWEGSIAAPVMSTVKAADVVERDSAGYEWCEDCKEYDHERHCCPRWNKVIRYTVDEIRRNADVVEVVRCKDCKYWQDQEEGIVEVPICTRSELISIRGKDDYCSFGERAEA